MGRAGGAAGAAGGCRSTRGAALRRSPRGVAEPLAAGGASCCSDLRRDAVAELAEGTAVALTAVAAAAAVEVVVEAALGCVKKKEGCTMLGLLVERREMATGWGAGEAKRGTMGVLRSKLSEELMEAGIAMEV